MQKYKLILFARVPIDMFIFGFVTFINGYFCFSVFFICWNGLVLCQFLLLFDEFQSEFPQLDVAPNEYGINCGCDGWGEEFLNHEQPVEKSVSQCCASKAEDQVFGATFSLNLANEKK